MNEVYLNIIKDELKTNFELTDRMQDVAGAVSKAAARKMFMADFVKHVQQTLKDENIPREEIKELAEELFNLTVTEMGF